MGVRVLIYLTIVAVAMTAVACERSVLPTPTVAPDYASGLVRTVGRDGSESVLGPAILPATAAEADFDPTEPVLVASINGEERAYSVAQMGIHEVVNDTLGGVPIAVTW